MDPTVLMNVGRLRQCSTPRSKITADEHTEMYRDVSEGTVTVVGYFNDRAEVEEVERPSGLADNATP